MDWTTMYDPTPWIGVGSPTQNAFIGQNVLKLDELSGGFTGNLQLELEYGHFDRGSVNDDEFIVRRFKESRDLVTTRSRLILSLTLQPMPLKVLSFQGIIVTFGSGLNVCIITMTITSSAPSI